MSFGTITSTESTFGSISGSIVGAVPGTLSGSVGVPGPQGVQGPQGIQGPPGPPGEGGTWGSIVGTLSNQTDLQTALNLKAPLASPAFTGDPTAPTAALGDNDTSLATTAFVQQELLSGTANARNLEVYVRNQTGSTLSAGAIVYINGATGNRPTVTLAQANNDANSAQTFGFVKASIANNGFGYVIVRGECEALDTSAFTEGAQLYLSPTVAGAYTTTKPSAPQHLVYVGIVVRSHPTQGVILVAVQNGYELDELHDVAIGTLANNDLLAYESSTDLWKNKSFGTLGLLTSSSLTGYATESWVTAGFAPIAAGQPTSGTVGQVLTKNSGTAYDSSWQTLIPGDRYVTSSSSSLTIGTGNKSLTIGTGLAYTPNQDVTISLSSDPTLHHMHGPVVSYNSGTGELTVDVQSITGSGTYSSWVVNVGGTVPLQTVEWGEVLGTLGDQTDLATALNAKLEVTDAASTYYLQTNPAGYITSSALTGYATESWVTSQGYETAANAAATYYPLTNPAGYLTSSALTGYATESWVTAGFYPLTGNPSSFLVAADIAGKANLSGDTFTGKVNTVASTTTNAGFNIPHGTAPSAPVNGDIWTTTSGLLARINGSTVQMPSLYGSNTFGGSTNTFSGTTLTFGSSTAASTINVGTGATVSGSTKTINVGTGAAAGSTTTITIGHTAGTTVTVNGATTFTHATQNIGTSTTTGTTSIAAGAMASGNTKTVNVGTGSLAGSTTNVTIGSSAGTSTTTLQGITNGVTAAADTNSTALATTAYVVGQAGSATPLVDGTAAVGTSLRYARQDHVHPTDTSRAPLASPALTGTPTAPTATAGTNTTQIATTAFVTAAVPALATLTDSRQLTNDTKAMSPNDVLWSVMSQDYIDIDRLNFTYTTTGTPQYNQVGSITTASRLNATVASSVIGRPFGTSQVDQVSPFLFRENWTSNINFNRKTHLSGRAGSFVLLTESTFNQAFYYGKVEGDAIGDLTRRGFGWRWSGGAGSRFVNLVVHNGTTQTTVASSFAVTQEVAFDWDLYSDGAGNVTLYINGAQVATSNAGPTSYQSAGTYAWWREEVWTTGAPSFGNSTGYFRGGRAAILNY